MVVNTRLLNLKKKVIKFYIITLTNNELKDGSYVSTKN